MDKKHSKGLRRECIAAAAGIVLLFQTYTFGVFYASCGTSLNASFGLPEQKGVVITTLLYVPFRGILTDLDLALDLNHTSFCDLIIRIESPAGISATISIYDEDTFVKGKQSFGWLTLDNESTIKIDSAPNLSIGSFQPTGYDSLSIFYGRQSFGMWKISICDQIYYDTGTLNGVRFDVGIEPQTTITALSIPEPTTCVFSIISSIILFKTKRL
jgi:subtilisin-like proprotein convertase family protein